MKVKNIISARQMAESLGFVNEEFNDYEYGLREGEMAAILQEGSIMIKLCDGFYYSLNDIKFELIKKDIL